MTDPIDLVVMDKAACYEQRVRQPEDIPKTFISQLSSRPRAAPFSPLKPTLTVMDLATFRIGLYGILALISVILLGLCAARLQYTTNLPPGDTLNNGVNFYDPVIIELLVTTLVTLGWSGFIIVLYFRDKPNSVVKTYREELVALVVIWLLWLGGSAAASDIWGALTFCQQFQPCQVLSAVLGMSWVGFFILTTICGASAKLYWEHGGLHVPLARRNSGKEKVPANAMGVAV